MHVCVSISKISCQSSHPRTLRLLTTDSICALLIEYWGLIKYWRSIKVEATVTANQITYKSISKSQSKEQPREQPNNKKRENGTVNAVVTQIPSQMFQIKWLLFFYRWEYMRKSAIYGMCWLAKRKALTLVDPYMWMKSSYTVVCAEHTQFPAFIGWKWFWSFSFSLTPNALWLYNNKYIDWLWPIRRTQPTVRCFEFLDCFSRYEKNAMRNKFDGDALRCDTMDWMLYRHRFALFWRRCNEENYVRSFLHSMRIHL